MGSRFNSEYYSWIDTLPTKLKNFQFDSIINAAYHTKIDYNDPSIYNTLVAYNWQQYDEQIMLQLIKTCNNYTVSDTMKTQVFGASTFALYSIESFVKHVAKLVPHIQNWLVIGAEWQLCTHYRDLGLQNLSKLPQFNFYGADWGFVKKTHCSGYSTVSQEDFEKDKLNWKKIDNHLYLLTHNNDTR